MKNDTIKIEDSNKKWKKSVIVRFFGVGAAMLFGVLSTILDGDTWSGALILIFILILIFNLSIVIPDKIIFGKNLVKKRYEDI